MKLHTLILEGDKEEERKAREAYPPVHTKAEYLRRKKRQSLPPLHNRSFYLCRMIVEGLGGASIDGSGKITLCAHQNRFYPGEGKYIRDEKQRVSIYYLEREQIDAIERAADEGTEAQVLPEILREALLDIAQRRGASGNVIEKLEAVFGRMAESGCLREEPIARLSKVSAETGLTARVSRLLSREAGEGWQIEILDRNGTTLRREVMGSRPGYVDRLGSGLYAKGEWRGGTFVITERFGKVVYSICP